jgi:hypothetical protein
LVPLGKGTDLATVATFALSWPAFLGGAESGYDPSVVPTFRELAGGAYMDERTQQLLDQALALPEEQLSLLVERLLEAIGPPGDEDVEFIEELNRRSKEVAEGTDGSIPWSELRDMR